MTHISCDLIGQIYETGTNTSIILLKTSTKLYSKTIVLKFQEIIG